MNLWLTDFHFSATGHAREDANVSKTENLAPQETLPAEITSPPTITEEEKEGKEACEEITTPSCPHEDTSKPKKEPNEAQVTTGGKSQILLFGVFKNQFLIFQKRAITLFHKNRE